MQYNNAALVKLVEKAKKGDKVAFGELYDLYAPKVLKFVGYKLNLKQDIEDVSSEIWLQVVKSLKSYEGKSSFNTWLFGISKNLIFQFYREKYANHENVSFDEYFENNLSGDNEFDEIEQIEKAENLSKKESLVTGILDKLSKIQRSVVELRFLKGYKISEVAKELDLTESNVKIIQMRAIKFLKEKVNYYEEN